ncbi:DUF305 domain-containing protein [Streptosporangium sp. NPDC000396]|uniref:DUF305 domain-containing protein n=1 Tax=Streptosporangium sp. NPDC000396 TaxID=3366185 RepID=UPI0036C7D734
MGEATLGDGSPETPGGEMGSSISTKIAAVMVLAAAAAGGGIGVAVANVGRLEPVLSGWSQASGPMGADTRSAGRMHGVNMDSEFDYLIQMVPHHEEAVAAAKHLRRSDRPEMRELGAGIVATQSAEITKMKAWLAAWYPGRSTAVGYRPMMRDLSKLSGDALDETFLQDMIPHHMAAMMMSQRLLARGLAEHGEVASFARAVRDTQRAQTFRMQQWLASWFDGEGMPHWPGHMWNGRDWRCGW